MQNLTTKQKQAVHEFFRGASQKDAYRAVYSTENMTEDSVHTKAHDLFQKPHVAAYLDELTEKAEREAILDRNEGLKILTEIARANVSKYLDENGEVDPKRLSQAGKDLESAQVQHGIYSTTRKLKLRNPIQAIERIAKMQGWDSADKLEVEGVTFNLNLGTGDNEEEQ